LFLRTRHLKGNAMKTFCLSVLTVPWLTSCASHVHQMAREDNATFIGGELIHDQETQRYAIPPSCSSPARRAVAGSNGSGWIGRCVGVAGAGLAMCGGNQLVQDTALSCGMAGAAPATQGGELAFERPHTLQPRPYPIQLRIDQTVDVTTV
jgi:hypothetical protein